MLFRSPGEATPTKRDKLSRSGKKAAEVKAAPEPEKAPPENAASVPEQAPPEPAAPPRPVEEGKLVYLKLSEMHPFHTFRPHPFKVRDDAKMQETVASIKANGVMVPGLARPEKDGNGYEIVAGHRRHHGCELAGLEEMPFIVREMTDLLAPAPALAALLAAGAALPDSLHSPFHIFIMGGLHAFLAVPAGGGVYSVLYVDDFCFPQLHPVGLVRRQLLRHLGNFECPDDI